jgi:hypothetical protein
LSLLFSLTPSLVFSFMWTKVINTVKVVSPGILLLLSCSPLAALAQDSVSPGSQTKNQLPSHREISNFLSEDFSVSPYPELRDDNADNIGRTRPAQAQSVESVLPASSAVTVMFCNNIKFDAEQRSAFPVTLFLARPLMDAQGNVIAPTNSLVSATVTPTKEGVRLAAEGLVVGGQYIPIQTPQLSVPILSEVQRQNSYYSGYSFRQQNPGVYFNVANNLQSWLGTQGVFNDGTSDIFGAGLAVAAGVASGMMNERNQPEEIKTTEVAQGVMLIFPLLNDVALPRVATQANTQYVSLTPQSTRVPCLAEEGIASPGTRPNTTPYRPPGGAPYYETNYRQPETTTSQTRSESFQRQLQYNQAD